MVASRVSRRLGVLSTFVMSAIVLAPLPAKSLVISELMASNDTTVQDDDGDFVDWLELYNDGGASVDLAGWYLTDSATNLTK